MTEAGVWQLIIPGISTIIVAVIGAFSAVDIRCRRRIEKRAEERSAIKAEESRLSMEMMSAAIDLALATATAVEKHEINGEMARARAAARQVQKDYESFLKRITARQVAKS